MKMFNESQNSLADLMHCMHWNRSMGKIYIDMKTILKLIFTIYDLRCFVNKLDFINALKLKEILDAIA